MNIPQVLKIRKEEKFEQSEELIATTEKWPRAKMSYLSKHRQFSRPMHVRVRREVSCKKNPGMIAC